VSIDSALTAGGAVVGRSCFFMASSWGDSDFTMRGRNGGREGGREEYRKESQQMLQANMHGDEKQKHDVQDGHGNTGHICTA
jgi:hypothetical protein